MTWRQQLDRPELRPVWQRIHERLSSGRPVTRVRIGPLDETAQSGLADLLGLDRLPGPQPSIALTRLDEVLREICGLPVQQIVAELIGPIGNRAQALEEAQAQRDSLWAWLRGHEVVTAQPALGQWVEHLRAGGLPGAPATRAREQLASALAVLDTLPAEGVPLPVLAARLLRGDAHALDDGTRLSTLVLRALSVLYEVPMPESAQERRALWARAGVTDDELSSTVLVAGLRPRDDGVVCRITRICADAGQAASLTLAQLRSPEELRLPSKAPVHVVENPSILALALRRFGTTCPPMVCTSGWPNTAGLHLLRQLADSAAGLHYHGDFDGEGIRIAAHVFARTSATPWRMSASDYRTGAAHVPDGGPPPGRLTVAPWDHELTPAIEELGMAVMEEVVADLLLEDLAQEI